MFSDQVEKWVPPKKGRSQVTRILRDLFYHQPTSRGTNLNVALDFLAGVLKKKAHIFVVSDFLSQDFENGLRRLNKSHDVVAVRLRRPRARGASIGAFVTSKIPRPSRW